MHEEHNIAVLIDADNTPSARIETVLQEVPRRGRILVKRAYGNWRKDCLKHWEPEIRRLAIRAAQQFDCATGKNATDIALTVDAMDLLHTQIYDTFVIVASDSDYTPLAMKLREAGAQVIGAGMAATPESFRTACDEFLILEQLEDEKNPFFGLIDDLLLSDDEEADEDDDPWVSLFSDEENLQDSPDLPEDELERHGIHNLFQLAYDHCKAENGFALLSAAGTFIKKLRPDFDCRTYGFKKLHLLLSAYPDHYQLIQYPSKGSPAILAYRCLS